VYGAKVTKQPISNEIEMIIMIIQKKINNEKKNTREIYLLARLKQPTYSRGERGAIRYIKKSTLQ
jgi:hypothetical protein